MSVLPQWHPLKALSSKAHSPHVAAGDQESAGVVSQVWEGVSRMTALAKQTTQAFLEGSVVLGPPLPGITCIRGGHLLTILRDAS